MTVKIGDRIPIDKFEFEVITSTTDDETAYIAQLYVYVRGYRVPINTGIITLNDTQINNVSCEVCNGTGKHLAKKIKTKRGVGER